MKIHLNFIILKKNSENSVDFSQFSDTLTQKDHKNGQLLRHLYNIQIL